MIADKQNHTVLRVNRYASTGNLVWQERAIDSLPFHERANSFLLLRSEDQSRILLLAFENLFFSNPRVHAMLFNEEWNLLSYKTYTHEWLTQPMIQYDEFNFPVEPFSNSPVKLTNDGNWMMISPSRMNQNYLLFILLRVIPVLPGKLKCRPPRILKISGCQLTMKNRQAFYGNTLQVEVSDFKMVSLAKYLLDEKNWFTIPVLSSTPFRVEIQRMKTWLKKTSFHCPMADLYC